MEALAFAGFGIAALAGVLTLALKALAAERRAGEQKARADVLDANLTSLAAQLADVTNQHRQEKDRGDRLDDALAQMVASVPVAGAYQRLLQIAAATKAAGRDGPRELPAPKAADAGLSTDLSRPGD